MLRKQMRGGSAQGPLDVASLSTQLQLYPALCEFLFRSEWQEDGTSRELGTLLLFGDGCRLKVMLNDKAQSLVAFATLDAEEDFLSEIDRMIVATSTDWRAARKFVPRK